MSYQEVCEVFITKVLFTKKKKKEKTSQIVVY